MMFLFYKIVDSIAKSDMTHVKLDHVDSITKETLENNVKLKIGTNLEDDSDNSFRVNGYFGEYLILRPIKHHTHPHGTYLICKVKSIQAIQKNKI